MKFGDTLMTASENKYTEADFLELEEALIGFGAFDPSVFTNLAKTDTAGPTKPRAVGPTEPRAVGPTEPRAVGPTEPRAVGPTEPRGVGPTGPRTEAGKSRSSQNAITHGLTAKLPYRNEEERVA